MMDNNDFSLVLYTLGLIGTDVPEEPVNLLDEMFNDIVELANSGSLLHIILDFDLVRTKGHEQNLFKIKLHEADVYWKHNLEIIWTHSMEYMPTEGRIFDPFELRTSTEVKE